MDLRWSVVYRGEKKVTSDDGVEAFEKSFKWFIIRRLEVNKKIIYEYIFYVNEAYIQSSFRL